MLDDFGFGRVGLEAVGRENGAGSRPSATSAADGIIDGAAAHMVSLGLTIAYYIKSVAARLRRERNPNCSGTTNPPRKLTRRLSIALPAVRQIQ